MRYKLYIENIEIEDGDLEWFTFHIEDFCKSDHNINTHKIITPKKIFNIKLEKIYDYRTNINEKERMDEILCHVESQEINKEPILCKIEDYIK